MNHTRHFLAILAGAVLFPAAYAQGNPNACTSSATAGTYSVTCSGWTVGMAGALVPTKQVGIATGDASGFWTGFTTINIGGQQIIEKATVTGQATLSPDCTGEITYNKETQAPIKIKFVVNPNTEEIFGLGIDKGSVISCVLKRMSNGHGKDK